MKKQLHVISDGKLSLDAFADIAGKIEPFTDRFHLREKQSTAKDLTKGVQLLVNKGIPLQKIIINDRADVAWSSNTGVQLAYHSLPIHQVKKSFPGLTAGCSVHSYSEAIEAARHGADYLLYGHVFVTRSKEGLPAKGLGELTSIAGKINTPVIAIGGIKPENVHQAMASGADGIAVMSGILHAEDPFKAARLYYEKLNQGGIAHGKHI